MKIRIKQSDFERLRKLPLEKWHPDAKTAFHDQNLQEWDVLEISSPRKVKDRRELQHMFFQEGRSAYLRVVFVDLFLPTERKRSIARMTKLREDMLAKLDDLVAQQEVSVIWDKIMPKFDLRTQGVLVDYILVRKERTTEIMKELSRLGTYPKLLTIAQILEIDGHIIGYPNNPKVNSWFLP